MPDPSTRNQADKPDFLADGLLSTDPARRTIEQEFLGRMFERLCVSSAHSPAEQLRAIVDVLDSGQVDRAIEQFAPDTAPATPQRFDEVLEFDYDRWHQRHG